VVRARGQGEGLGGGGGAARWPLPCACALSAPAAANRGTGPPLPTALTRHPLPPSPAPFQKVYDATPFLENHPGGAESILISTGMDATDEFNGIHSSKAKAMLVDYYIGDLATPEQVRMCVAAGLDCRGGGWGLRLGGKREGSWAFTPC
jgi:hypothetical protein